MFKLILILAVLIAQPALAKTRFVEVTPVITAGAYSANDTVGDVQTVYSQPVGQKPFEALGSIVLVDKAKQKAETEVCLFSGNSAPTVSADNAAFDFTDAVALNSLGCISVAAADYIDSSSNSIATKRGLSLLMPMVGGQKIYSVLVTRGTPTYASTSDLQIRFGFYESE